MISRGAFFTCQKTVSRSRSSWMYRSVASTSVPRTLRINRYSTDESLRKTPLYDLHVKLGAKMVPFAGFLMPLLYSGQSHVDSHQWVRSKAGLFDVSHMCQHRFVRFRSISHYADFVSIDSQEQVQQRFSKRSLLVICGV